MLNSVRHPRGWPVTVATAGLFALAPLLPAPAGAQSPARRGGGRRPPAPPVEGSGALSLMAPGPPGSAEGFTRLPFNLVWGDSPQRLVRALAGGGTKVTERRVSTNGTREVWTVEGLLRAGPKLGSTLLTFRDQALAGIELRYGLPDWTTEQFNEAMGFLRRQLERDLGGPGELVSRQTVPVPAPTPAGAATPAADPSPTVANGPAIPGDTPAPAPTPAAEPPIQQTLTGYSWKRGDTVVELFYFAAEQPQKALAFRTLSVHFRYHDPVPENPDALPGLDAAPAPPGAENLRPPRPPLDPWADPLPQ